MQSKAMILVWRLQMLDVHMQKSGMNFVRTID